MSDGRRVSLAVLGLMILGCWLRSRGANYPASYHPDEIVYVSHSVYMAISGDPRPGWYEHATLHLSALTALYRLIGSSWLPSTIDPDTIQRLSANPPAHLFIMARWFSVLWSVAQIPLFYVIARFFGSRGFALGAAGLLAITPLDVWESHFALNNQMVSFWMLLGLLGCLRVARDGNGYMLAAIAAGLAEATRYTGVFVLLALVVAHASFVIRFGDGGIDDKLRWPPRGLIALSLALVALGGWELTLGAVTGLTFENFVRSTGPLEETLFRLRLKFLYTAFGPILSALPFDRLFLVAGLAGLAAIAAAQFWPVLRAALLRQRSVLLKSILVSGLAFIVAMPWVLLDSDLVMSHIRLQLQLNAEPRFGFDRLPSGWQYQRWIYELVVGLPFSLGLALYLLAIVGFVAALRRASAERLVVLTLVCSYVLFLGAGSRVFLRYLVPLMPSMCLLAALGSKTILGAHQSVGYRALARAAVVAAVAFTGYFTWTTNERFNPDTRLLAANWIAAHVEPGESIGMNTIPELSPPVDRTVYRVVLYDRTIRSEWVDPIIYLPRYLVVTSAIYNRALRDPAQYDFYMVGYERVWAGESPFAPLIRWDSPFPLRDLFARLDPMLAAYYVSPTIEIYRR